MDEITQRFEYCNGTLKNKLHEFNSDKLAEIERSEERTSELQSHYSI